MTSPESKFTVFLIVQIGAALAILATIVLWPSPWNATHWMGLLIAIPAGVLLFVARYQLGRSFSVTAQARKLVTHGLYSQIRNPIYVFSALLVFGFLVVVQRPYLFAILAALLAVQTIRARKEANVLEEKFGEEYRKYKQNTWF